MERVFDICHGCRRCVSLCQSFPTLFDLVDASESLEVDGVAKADYRRVVDQCYLCDLCHLTKCPYVPPHDWDLDFPHLMLRAKAVAFKKGEAKLRDKVLTSTDAMGAAFANPVAAPVVNLINTVKPLRAALEKVAGVDAESWLPEYASKPLRKRLKFCRRKRRATWRAARRARSLFSRPAFQQQRTCPGRRPCRCLFHNGIPVTLTPRERCCGMPKLELGDLEAVHRAKEFNIPILARLVDQGWDLTALMPSCVLMFKQELPLMFPEDVDVLKVKAASSTRSNI